MTAALIALGTFIIGMFGAFWAGRITGRARIDNKILKADAKATKTREEIEDAIQNVDDTHLADLALSVGLRRNK